MSSRLAGKTVLITAAAQGIGRASVEMFAREGARVIATDINKDALAQLQGIASVETHILDVTDRAAINALVEKAGQIDVLFNCAGYVHAGNILECDDKAWDLSFDINARAMFHTIRAVLPGMLERKKGTIVNIASAASSVKGVANRFAYGASKAAVVGLTKSSLAKASVVTQSAQVPSSLHPWHNVSTHKQKKQVKLLLKCTLHSLHVNQWAVSVKQMKLLHWHCTWHLKNPVSLLARST
jgi:NADP-dependent 3-hydroxy acid dehydrogenase YdfG